MQQLPYDAKKADIWALGIVLFIMTQGTIPFKGLNENELYSKIKSG